MRALCPLITTALCLATASGCVEKSRRLSKAEQDLAKKIVLAEEPKPQHPLDVRFENKIRLLGYDVSTSQAEEGKMFQVTWYWRVIEPLGEGWKIFTHLADADRKSRINLDAARPVRKLYPVVDWKKGQFIRDTQEVTLPADWDSNEAIFFLGFWNGPHRLHVTKGKNDGDNRAEGLVLQVGGSAASADKGKDKGKDALPRLIAHPASGPIALDGALDEADWGKAQPSGPFVNTMTGSPGAFPAAARLLYDAEHLYVGFEVKDDYLKSTFENADDHLWEQDTVEVMVDPDGDGKNYFEIQVAPSGVSFDTRYDARRVPRPFGDMAWQSKVKSGVKLEGTLNDDQADRGYSVELALPWSAFAAGPTPAEPPKAGATWRINLFVMDAREKGQRAVGWSPPRVGDFHTLERFGRVIFTAAAGETAQVGTPAAAAAIATGQPAAAPAAAPTAQ
ncbi:MAG: carbohydrate-binding family 9-like protein [Myxococcales bacterium]|nr:carbohydrate-binding family 9-like protein [Myxococcales bacterium]